MSNLHILGQSDVWKNSHGTVGSIGACVGYQGVLHEAVQVVVSVCREVQFLKLVFLPRENVARQYLYVVVSVRSLVLVVEADDMTEFMHNLPSLLKTGNSEADRLALVSVTPASLHPNS